eukprot:480466-Amphidinium_carterae.1
MHRALNKIGLKVLQGAPRTAGNIKQAKELLGQYIRNCLTGVSEDIVTPARSYYYELCCFRGAASAAETVNVKYGFA